MPGGHKTVSERRHGGDVRAGIRVLAGIALAALLAMLAMLPFLVSALQMQAPLSAGELEQALVEGIRERLVQGWTVVGVHGDDDELVFTLTKGKRVEQHVAHIDESAGNALRVDTGVTLPARLIAPSELMQEALRSGGIEIGGDCGSIEARGYLIDASARGADAAALVATTLKDSEDVESAVLEDNVAKFSIELADNKHAELRVTLSVTGKVRAAEVRHYEYGGDVTTHAQQRKMKQKIGDKVTSIVDGTFGPTLRGDKRFTFDTSAFESNNPGDHSCGC